MDDTRVFETALGDEVRAWRRRRRLTLDELADMAGVSRSTLQRLEAGTHATSVPNTWAIAKALDVPLATLVRRAEEAMAEAAFREETARYSEEAQQRVEREAEELDISLDRYNGEFFLDYDLAKASLEVERLRARRARSKRAHGVADLAARDEDRD